MRTCRLGMVLGLLVCPGLAMAQAPGAPGANDPLGEPTEYGLRLTPAMARTIAWDLTRGLFVRRYELEESKAKETAELIARRIMQFAHEHEAAGQDLAEYFIGEMTNYAAKRRNEGSPGLPREIAQGLGTRLIPVLPEIRECANGLMQDVRPMLGFKQQFKLTTEIAAMNVALDALDKNMQSWAQGDVDAFRDPFGDPDREPEKDEKGETRALRDARQLAESQSDAKQWAGWDRYVEEAKKYYELDPAQAAAADSLLREYKERAQAALGGEAEWRKRLYNNRLWWSLSTSLPGRWGNPLHMLLDREYQKMCVPVETLGDALKRRIGEIPTLAQREAAERRVQTALAEKGLNVEELAAPASEPAPVAATAPAAAPAQEATP